MYADLAFSLPVDKLFTYRVPDDMPCRVGSRVSAPFGKRQMTGVVTALLEEAPEGIVLQEISRSVDAEPVLEDIHFTLGRWMQKIYFASLGECLHTMTPTARREKRVALRSSPRSQQPAPTLSTAQRDVVERVLKRQSLLHYLYGVTGSGKTEVFLHIAERVIAQGQSVIYLVPEITLSYQLIEYVAGRFGDTSAIFHSRLSASERFGQWRAIQRGEKKIVVGTRSAIFAPVQSLGLVVMDEEQDASYKSGNTPRYHTRHIAVQRCQEAGALFVMGSATPSLEMWYQIERDRLSCHRLRSRVSGGRMPEIELVDMNKEKGILSQRLLRCMAEVHRESRQSILFINRRGFARVLRCMNCSYTVECVRCSVPLTFHRSEKSLLCHYCGYAREPIAQCPECQSTEIGYSSFGSQKIEEELKAIFPEFRIARLDSDVAQKKGEVERVLEEFSRGGFDVLLGTQMIAKGLNFPGVKLAGVVLADVGLTIPDFRSAERTFSHILQVSGRAGRFSPDGLVVIQSYRIQNPAIRSAVAHDVDRFFEKELSVREELNFPPFSRMIRLLVRGKDKEKVRVTAEDLARTARKKNARGVEILGPSFCLLSRLSNNYRMHILFLSVDFRALHELVRSLLAVAEIPRALYCEVDLDPLSVI